MKSGDQIMTWCRLHRVDPHRCHRVLIFPLMRVAIFAIYDVDSSGRLFLRDEDIAWHWVLRFLRIPPPDDWTVEWLKEGGRAE